MGKSYLFGPPAAPDAEALCTLLFYPLEGWFSICPQSVRADGSAVPKPELEGWQKLEETEELEELKLKALARMECRIECREWTVNAAKCGIKLPLSASLLSPTPPSAA